MNTKVHYENHLSNYYSWMFGNRDDKLQENRDFFKKYDISASSNETAIDLGAGNGFQTIPLAELGFKVKAVDFSRKLLKELEQNCSGLDVEIIEDDILNFSVYNVYRPSLIVCMGDTITHLNSANDLKRLILNSYSILDKKGKFIVTYRDLSAELQGTQRFIPVRSDENRISTCFLEYEKHDVNVFDIVHEKKGDKWVQKISTYKKLKIPREIIANYFSDVGFSNLQIESEKGFVTVIGVKE
ncbi:class I SAM-dependent methyltransferase [Fulvivirgaceae bacterium BMA10]|uniref:Class I SAM-dependent methyltransferase n=1 Tax=Splendidivirga corallicola TaxID=3051826 RepID=A0ABT8KM43_9BACT|nr:class I SAM-dependent methyltransferase [Fulvivirgaceae bacterium BMA10]